MKWCAIIGEVGSLVNVSILVCLLAHWDFKYFSFYLVNFLVIITTKRYLPFHQPNHNLALIISFKKKSITLAGFCEKLSLVKLLKFAFVHILIFFCFLVPNTKNLGQKPKTRKAHFLNFEVVRLDGPIRSHHRPARAWSRRGLCCSLKWSVGRRVNGSLLDLKRSKMDVLLHNLKDKIDWLIDWTNERWSKVLFVFSNTSPAFKSLLFFVVFLSKNKTKNERKYMSRFFSFSSK